MHYGHAGRGHGRSSNNRTYGNSCTKSKNGMTMIVPIMAMMVMTTSIVVIYVNISIDVTVDISIDIPINIFISVYIFLTAYPFGISCT